MKWVWPLSWYYRIKALEAENAALKAVGLELTRRLSAEKAAHAIAQTACMAAYMGALSDQAAAYANYPAPTGPKP